MYQHNTTKLLWTRLKPPVLLEAQKRLHRSSFLLWLLPRLNHEAITTPEISEMQLPSACFYSWPTPIWQPGYSRECASNQSVLRAPRGYDNWFETSLIRSSHWSTYCDWGNKSTSAVLPGAGIDIGNPRKLDSGYIFRGGYQTFKSSWLSHGWYYYALLLL